MYWYVTAVSSLFLLAAAFSVIFALYAWNRKPVPGSAAFSVFVLSVTCWVLIYLLQIVSGDLAAKLAWAKLQYLSISLIPASWLAFSLHYTNRKEWLTPKHWVLYMMIPLSTLIFVITNDSHQLVWVQINRINIGYLSYIKMVPGVWYWIAMLYLFGAFFAGSLMILTATRYEIASLVPQQALVLLVGLALPWFGGAFYILGMSTINLTPLSFALCAFVVARYPLNFRFLKRTPLKNHMVLNSLDDGVLVIDCNQVIVDANLAMTDVAQRPFSSIIGQQLSDIFPQVTENYDQLKEKTLDLDCEEGYTRCYEVKRSALLDWRKFASSEMLVFHDLSERKQLEALRDELTHSMVHDLRSPISNSLFALEMLRNGSLDNQDADSKQLVQLTYENTEKVLNLINNILDIGRLENGNIPVSLTAVSLAKLVDRVLSGHTPRAQAKDIIFVREIPTELPVAWADEKLIERVLQNIVDNSIKFSPVGGVIKVTAVLVDGHDIEKRRIHVTVVDEGPGLTPQSVETIFDKFVTGAEKESGNGLGLAFCQIALAAHNQKIWVDSKPGQGASFSFSLALPPQLPDDAYPQDEWPDTSADQSSANLLFSPSSPTW
ncbi:MAG: hypothetical protein CSA11_04000 [Chloroflexi bacterium]|nr:MAG: hypothetical protein CSB13_01235 [Chloroflexota bacterium]PIE81510.1 MAG: hypothetical protein CSA11_04000 [Chloroflexota bacterium]